MEEVSTFWDNILTFLSQHAVKFALTLVAGCVVLFVGFRLVHLLMKLFRRSKAAQKLDPTVVAFIDSLGAVLLKVLVIIAAAGIVGIPTASIIALLGSVGVAIGLAMQGSLANLAGGVMILLFHPFQKGDYISLPDIEAGTVTNISIFYTEIVTASARRIVIPNGSVSNSALTNYSSQGVRRLELDFSVSYEANLDEVRRSILSVAAEREKIRREPLPEVVVTALEDSGVKVQFRGWCDFGDYFTESFAMQELVKKRFDAEGIAIPFPQMDVHVK